MNPSSSGWIRKFGHLIDRQKPDFKDFESLYDQLLDNGFIYGLHLFYPKFIETEHELTEDEIAKLNLLTALYFVYRFETGIQDFDQFINAAHGYYRETDMARLSIWGKMLSGSSAMAQLERLIDSRVYVEDDILSRTFGNTLTNSLLFIDVLTFKNYLANNVYSRDYAQMLEYITINIAYHALNSKGGHEIDQKLIQILDASLTFVNYENIKFDGSYRDLLKEGFSATEKNYLLDIACLTVWEDQSLDFMESDFIYGIGKDLGKDKNEIKTALERVKHFFEKNIKNIPLLKDKNLASQFYDGMSKNVGKLILRNSKRLKKELAESKELMGLLTKSTTKELSPEEKKKVQSQLIDIFKSIPSLAIFMLPGGAILLPIFIKLIPTMLPSAFDDNRIEKK